MKRNTENEKTNTALSGTVTPQQLRVRTVCRRVISPVVVVSLIAVVLFAVLPLLSDRIGVLNNMEQKVSVRWEAEAEPAAQSPVPEEETVPSGPASETNPSGGITVSVYSLLKSGDSYSSVIALHERLTDLGYLESDEPSETYNEATAAAVSLFQRTAHLEETGVADSALQELLFSKNALAYECKLGDSGSDVKKLQLVLKDLGYYTGKISGYFGPSTEDALLFFQLRNDLSQDGIVNAEDREILYSGDARPAVDPTPVPTPKPTAKQKTTSSPKKTSSPKATPTPKSSKTTPTPKPDSKAKATATPKGGEEASVTPLPPDEGSSKKEEKKKETEPEKTESSAPKDSGNKSYGGGISGMIACAQDQIGKPYVRGDEGPNSYDCSGLVYYCLKKAGVSTSRMNAKSFAKVSKWTLIEDMGDLQKGDLLFFKDDSRDYVTHTGIYIGGGTMIDASSSSGKVVKRSCTTSYWKRNFVCARRVF